MQVAILLTFFGTFALIAPALQAQTSATFGEVIALGGIPSDMVLDESRQRLYLVNTAANRIDIWDYSGKSVIGSITVGNRPLGAAMSVDNAFLYVANHDDSTLSVITLSGAMGSQGAVTATISLPAPPQGVEVELSGRVVICTDGNGNRQREQYAADLRFHAAVHLAGASRDDSATGCDTAFARASHGKTLDND